MDEFTKRRLAHNEQLFREINEAREHASAAPDDVPLGFVCECSDPECTARIRLTGAEYGRIRESPDRFIVRPGHAIRGLERVVAARPGFEVVEKHAA
jgi:uncharacterized protein (DUF1499 family)